MISTCWSLVVIVIVLQATVRAPAQPMCCCAVLCQVEFERAVDAKGNIEVWLQRLVDGMQDTVKQVCLLQVLPTASPTEAAQCMCSGMQTCLLHPFSGP